MVTELTKKECTGCGVCAAICPKQCIQLRMDEEGFWYPCIDQTKCIQCGLCDEKCHMQHICAKLSLPPETLIAYHRSDEDRRSSSSGGVFIALARKVVECGGTVYGVSLDQDLKASYKRAVVKAELSPFQGSKYVQSEMSQETFRCIQKDVQAGKQVLFSGTPCQIGAVLLYLGGHPRNLLTVGFICHGVPSPLVWERYLHWQSNVHHHKPTQASFRDKKYGWTKFSMQIHFSNQAIYRKTLDKDPYLRVFLKNIVLRPSCYCCEYKGLSKLSAIDIILADKWGTVSGVLPNMSDDKGISTVMLQSDAAKCLWTGVSDQFYFDHANFQEVIQSNSSYDKSATQNKNRSAFFQNLNGMPFDKLANRFAKRSVWSRVRKTLFQVAHWLAEKSGVLKIIRDYRRLKADCNP